MVERFRTAIAGARVLDIGGGIGAIQAELLAGGAREGEVLELVAAVRAVCAGTGHRKRAGGAKPLSRGGYPWRSWKPSRSDHCRSQPRCLLFTRRSAADRSGGSPGRTAADCELPTRTLRCPARRPLDQWRSAPDRPMTRVFLHPKPHQSMRRRRLRVSSCSKWCHVRLGIRDPPARLKRDQSLGDLVLSRRLLPSRYILPRRSLQKCRRHLRLMDSASGRMV